MTDSDGETGLPFARDRPQDRPAWRSGSRRDVDSLQNRRKRLSRDHTDVLQVHFFQFFSAPFQFQL